MEHAQILHRCFRCGYCKLPGSYQDLNCPSYLKSRFETYAPGGRMWLLRAWLDGEIETSQRLADILFSCAACGNCVEHCVFPEFKADLLNAFTAGREELIEKGTVPETVAEYLKRIQLYGNAYGLPEADRGSWADGLDIQPYSGQEYLFYVGCPGSFDERGQAMARAVARLLKKWDVNFGILGEQLTDHVVENLTTLANEVDLYFESPQHRRPGEGQRFDLHQVFLGGQHRVRPELPRSITNRPAIIGGVVVVIAEGAATGQLDAEPVDRVEETLRVSNAGEREHPLALQHREVRALGIHIHQRGNLHLSHAEAAGSALDPQKGALLRHRLAIRNHLPVTGADVDCRHSLFPIVLSSTILVSSPVRLYNS